MKVTLFLLALVTVALGKPISSDEDQSHNLADTAKYLQSIAHASVVDILSPLHVSLSSLESTYMDYMSIASEHSIPIPELSIPRIDVKSIMTCKPKTSPRYSMVLKYITDHQDEIQDHLADAKKLTTGLRFVSQLIINQKIDSATLITVAKKMSEYLTGYASMISAIRSTVCEDKTPSSSMQSSSSSSQIPIESNMDNPMYPSSPVDRGFSLNGGGVGKGFDLNGGGVGKGFDLNGGGVGKGFSLNGGGVGKGFSLNGGGVGKGFDLTGGGVGKGFDLNGGGVGKGFDLTGGGVGKGFDLTGGGVGKGFDLNGGGVTK